jgi:hypothetical protein
MTIMLAIKVNKVEKTEVVLEPAHTYEEFLKQRKYAMSGDGMCLEADCGGQMPGHTLDEQRNNFVEHCKAVHAPLTI